MKSSNSKGFVLIGCLVLSAIVAIIINHVFWQRQMLLQLERQFTTQASLTTKALSCLAVVASRLNKVSIVLPICKKNWCPLSKANHNWHRCQKELKYKEDDIAFLAENNKAKNYIVKQITVETLPGKKHILKLI